MKASGSPVDPACHRHWHAAPIPEDRTPSSESIDGSDSKGEELNEKLSRN